MMAVLGSDFISDGEWDELAENLKLSPRQSQIVGYILNGKSDRQIALELHIAVPTVRTHMTRMFHKFDVNDRVELLLCVFQSLKRHWIEDRVTSPGN